MSLVGCCAPPKQHTQSWNWGGISAVNTPPQEKEERARDNSHSKWCWVPRMPLWALLPAAASVLWAEPGSTLWGWLPWPVSSPTSDSFSRSCSLPISLCVASEGVAVENAHRFIGLTAGFYSQSSYLIYVYTDSSIYTWMQLLRWESTIFSFRSWYAFNLLNWKIPGQTVNPPK